MHSLRRQVGSVCLWRPARYTMLTAAALSAPPALALTLIPRRQTAEVPELNVTDGPHFPYRSGGDRDPWSTRHTFKQTINFRDKYGADHPEYSRVGADG